MRSRIGRDDFLLLSGKATPPAWRDGMASVGMPAAEILTECCGILLEKILPQQHQGKTALFSIQYRGGSGAHPALPLCQPDFNHGTLELSIRTLQRE
jgi:hypothetical protein